MEYYNGHTNGYEGYRKDGEEHFMFIASQKNPRILGIMWHDIIFSDVVGRPTVWMDVPKNLRTDVGFAFENGVSWADVNSRDKITT